MNFPTLQYFSTLKSALSVLFGDAAIARCHRISGGDSNEAYSLVLTDQTTVFMKVNSQKNASYFEAEAAGLAAIARTGAIRVPHALGFGTEKGSSFLLLSFVGNGKRVSEYWEQFARQLAAMHRAETKGLTPGSSFGFFCDNFIGSRPQVNTLCGSWTAFFRDFRLEPQFRSAESYFDKKTRKEIGRLMDRLENILVEPKRPSLLHGDLWSGNFLTGAA